MWARVDPVDVASMLDPSVSGSTAPPQVDQSSPFFTAQTRRVLANAGRIDPEQIEAALAAGAYRGLAHALGQMARADVVREVARSGLRGRGGAAFPTGTKWAAVAAAPGAVKDVIANGDEGDPGTFANRALLESDPHRVLEGMIIAGYAVGAGRGIWYVRSDYSLALERARRAVEAAERVGLLGDRVLDTEFAFRVEVRRGAGAFVCGEETALIASIEGRRAEPRPRPPYPSEHGLHGCPTLINNVETLANVPLILAQGADWFAQLGSVHGAGTKVLSLAGHVQRPGVIEVPLGVTLRHVVMEMGGGAPAGGEVKAAHLGGPAGGCVPAALFDAPVDYDRLAALGAGLGSGGVTVLGAQDGMVELAHFFAGFSRRESCGKCAPCRAGTVRMEEVLARLLAQGATAADLTLLRELCATVRETSLCGLGQNAPNPILSTLRFFPQEYAALLATRENPPP